MRKYRKFDPRFWKDERVIKLGVGEKAIAAYLITAQANRIGLFVFSVPLAIEDLFAAEKQRDAFPDMYRKRILGTIASLKFEFDDGARVLYLPRWWRYNRPENPKVLIGNLRDLDDLPRSPLISKFKKNLKYLDPVYHDLFKRRLRNVCDTSRSGTGTGTGTGERRGGRARRGSPPRGKAGPDGKKKTVRNVVAEKLRVGFSARSMDVSTPKLTSLSFALCTSAGYSAAEIDSLPKGRVKVTKAEIAAAVASLAKEKR